MLCSLLFTLNFCNIGYVCLSYEIKTYYCYYLFKHVFFYTHVCVVWKEVWGLGEYRSRNKFNSVHITI